MNDTTATPTPATWGVCPRCGCAQLEGDAVTIEGTHALQCVVCLKCGASWEDVYTADYRRGVTA